MLAYVRMHHVRMQHISVCAYTSCFNVSMHVLHQCTHVHSYNRCVYTLHASTHMLQWNQSKDDYMGKQQEQIFQDQIAFLVKREKYTLNEFYEGLK